MKTEEIDKILNAYKSIQKLNNDLDELHDTVSFKHDLKKRTKMLQTSLDLVLNQLYRTMSATELEVFNAVTLNGQDIKSFVLSDVQ